MSVTFSGFQQFAAVALRQCSFPVGGQETCAIGPVLQVVGQPYTLDVSYALPGMFPGVLCDSPPVGSCYLKAVYSSGETAATAPLTFAAGPPIQPPQASFAMNLSNGSPLTVQADASASSDPNGGPGSLEYAWDWGDGFGDQGVVTPSHVYAQPGSYEITLWVVNEWGLFDIAPQTVSMGVPGGQTVTTDPSGVGATPDEPIQTSLRLPATLGPTNVSISTQPVSGGASGFEFFDREVVIETGGVIASTATPFVVKFTVDKSKLDGPPAVAPTDVQVFRDGVPVADCAGVSAAAPDPCVASKTVNGDGDGVFEVRTSHFSTFSFARFDWDFSGFYSPVDNLPTVNTVSPGRAIPVRFTLGAGRGLDIFASGYPKSQPYTCETGQPFDQIEETVSANASTLKYEPGTNRYSYVWKTTSTWSGCRELTLRFRDGTEVRTHFRFK